MVGDPVSMTKNTFQFKLWYDTRLADINPIEPERTPEDIVSRLDKVREEITALTGDLTMDFDEVDSEDDEFCRYLTIYTAISEDEITAAVAKTLGGLGLFGQRVTDFGDTADERAFI